jgi:hypothetical protein
MATPIASSAVLFGGWRSRLMANDEPKTVNGCIWSNRHGHSSVRKSFHEMHVNQRLNQDARRLRYPTGHCFSLIHSNHEAYRRGVNFSHSDMVVERPMGSIKDIDKIVAINLAVVISEKRANCNFGAWEQSEALNNTASRSP